MTSLLKINPQEYEISFISGQKKKIKLWSVIKVPYRWVKQQEIDVTNQGNRLPKLDF